MTGILGTTTAETMSILMYEVGPIHIIGQQTLIQTC